MSSSTNCRHSQTRLSDNILIHKGCTNLWGVLLQPFHHAVVLSTSSTVGHVGALPADDMRDCGTPGTFIPELFPVELFRAQMTNVGPCPTSAEVLLP